MYKSDRTNAVFKFGTKNSIKSTKPYFAVIFNFLAKTRQQGDPGAAAQPGICQYESPFGCENCCRFCYKNTALIQLSSRQCLHSSPHQRYTHFNKRKLTFSHPSLTWRVLSCLLFDWKISYSFRTFNQCTTRVLSSLQLSEIFQTTNWLCNFTYIYAHTYRLQKTHHTCTC